MRTLIFTFLLTACSAGSDSDGDTSSLGSGSETGSETGSAVGSDPVDVPSGTNGTIPGVTLEAPEFSATNRDGGARDREDLLGHPTIMWFYPAAGTYG